MFGTEELKMVEKTCGSCYWFMKMDKPVSQVIHYCNLHYMQEARGENEKACNDWYEIKEEDFF